MVRRPHQEQALFMTSHFELLVTGDSVCVNMHWITRPYLCSAFFLVQYKSYFSHSHTHTHIHTALLYTVLTHHSYIAWRSKEETASLALSKIKKNKKQQHQKHLSNPKLEELTILSRLLKHYMTTNEKKKLNVHTNRNVDLYKSKATTKLTTIV